MEYWIIWLLIVFFLSFIEVITVNLITIWFIISAIVSLLLSFFVDSFTIQFIVFGVLGIILLLTTGKSLKNIFDEGQTRTNADRVIGMTGIVTEEIKKNIIGEVKVDGKKWSAISTKAIKVGEEVTIEKIDGVKLVVKKETLDAPEIEEKTKTNKKSSNKKTTTNKNKKEKED
ncbi:MAG: NfeD family protein [Bacilli bacterium]|nr:NfeD family protein [Bacilli bacterium]